MGTLIDYKNQLEILKACRVLKNNNVSFLLTVVGDGPMKDELNVFIKKNKLHPEVRLVGKKNHIELRQLYRDHDFVVQAPLKEGFGKVPVEGFFHGVVPVINNISMAPHITGNEERGFLFDVSKENDLSNTLISICNKTNLLPQMIRNGRQYAQTQTLEKWAEDYYQTIVKYYSEA